MQSGRELSCSIIELANTELIRHFYSINISIITAATYKMVDDFSIQFNEFYLRTSARPPKSRHPVYFQMFGVSPKFEVLPSTGFTTTSRFLGKLWVSHPFDGDNQMTLRTVASHIIGISYDMKFHRSLQFSYTRYYERAHWRESLIPKSFSSKS